MWIKRKLLETRPEEILAEIETIEAEVVKVTKKINSLQCKKGDLLSQVNQAKQALGYAKATLASSPYGRTEMEIRVAGLEAQLKALRKSIDPKVAEIDEKIEEYKAAKAELVKQEEKLKSELEEYVKIG